MKTNNVDNKLILQSKKFEKEKEYWVKKLQGNIIMSSFPFDFQKTKLNKDKRENVNFKIPNIIFNKLIDMSNRSEMGTYMILLSGVIYLLHRYTDSEDIIVGMPVLKQKLEDEYINKVLTLRSMVKKTNTYREFLLQIRDTINMAIEHQNFSFDALAQLLNITPVDDNSPLFNVIVLMDNIHDKKAVHSIKSNVGVSFSMSKDHISINIDYSTDLYKKETMERLIEHLVNFLRTVTRNPSIKLSHVEILSEDEKK